MSCSFPGIATAGVAIGPISTLAGKRLNFELIACSQLTSLPVYALIRPMMAVRVLSAPRTPLFSGLPSRIRWMNACSESWVISRGPVFARRLDHAARSEELLVHRAVEGRSDLRSGERGLYAGGVIERHIAVIADIAALLERAPARAVRLGGVARQ